MQKEKYGVDAIVIQADLSEPEAASELVRQSFQHFDRLDVCISNSGVSNYVKDKKGKLVRFRFQDTPTAHLEKCNAYFPLTCSVRIDLDSMLYR